MQISGHIKISSFFPLRHCHVAVSGYKRLWNAWCINLGTVIPDSEGLLTKPRLGMFVRCTDSQFIRCQMMNSHANGREGIICILDKTYWIKAFQRLYARFWHNVCRDTCKIMFLKTHNRYKFLLYPLLLLLLLLRTLHLFWYLQQLLPKQEGIVQHFCICTYISCLS